jgi:mRNA interferase MazF
MTRHTVIYEQFALVRVPFPFTDRATAKRRPALIISSSSVLSSAGQSVMAMITSAVHSAWPLDHPIKDLNLAGLNHPSVIRFKVFTLDDRLILGQIGQLGSHDRSAVSAALRLLFDMPRVP